MMVNAISFGVLPVQMPAFTVPDDSGLTPLELPPEFVSSQNLQISSTIIPHETPTRPVPDEDSVRRFQEAMAMQPVENSRTPAGSSTSRAVCGWGVFASEERPAGLVGRDDPPSPEFPPSPSLRLTGRRTDPIAPCRDGEETSSLPAAASSQRDMRFFASSPIIPDLPSNAVVTQFDEAAPHVALQVVAETSVAPSVAAETSVAPSVAAEVEPQVVVSNVATSAMPPQITPHVSSPSAPPVAAETHVAAPVAAELEPPVVVTDVATSAMPPQITPHVSSPSAPPVAAETHVAPSVAAETHVATPVAAEVEPPVIVTDVATSAMPPQITPHVSSPSVPPVAAEVEPQVVVSDVTTSAMPPQIMPHVSSPSAPPVAAETHVAPSVAAETHVAAPVAAEVEPPVVVTDVATLAMPPQITPHVSSPSVPQVAAEAHVAPSVAAEVEPQVVVSSSAVVERSPQITPQITPHVAPPVSDSKSVVIPVDRKPEEKAPASVKIAASTVVPVAVAQPPPVAVAGADVAVASARTTEIVETIAEIVEAVSAQIEVTPSLVKGEGEILIRLQPTVLDGSEIKLSAKDNNLSLIIVPATPAVEHLVAGNLPRLEVALAEHLPTFGNISVAVAKKGKFNESK